MILEPEAQETYEEWPVLHQLMTGGMLLLLYLEGMLVVSEHGSLHMAVLTFLWIASFPVIHYFMCRKCHNYGRACPIPLEGGLVHFFYKKSNDPPGILGWAGVGLCYLMRLGYPLMFFYLYWGDYSIFLVLIYILTISLFSLILRYAVGCPHCGNKDCFLCPKDNNQSL